MMNKLSILTIALIGGLSMTACTASERTANDKAASAGGNEQTNSTAENKRTENKSAENKPAETEQKKLVEVADGRNDRKSKDATADEIQMVKDDFKTNESLIKQKIGDTCGSDQPSVDFVSPAGEGSFTKPNSKQKAFLYPLCANVRDQVALGLLVIFENGKAITHSAFEIGNDDSLSTLPDINQNGLTELVTTGGSMHQGIMENGVGIYEIKDGNLSSVGGAITYEGSGIGPEDDSKTKTTAYKITVEPSANPTFYRETYESKTKGDSYEWILKKKAEKFSPEKDAEMEVTKID